MKAVEDRPTRAGGVLRGLAYAAMISTSVAIFLAIHGVGNGR